MAKTKIVCPHCGQLVQAHESDLDKRIKCPHCKNLINGAPPSPASRTRDLFQQRRRQRKLKWIAGLVALVLAMIAAGVWFVQPMSIHWPDRRPIGVLFLASNYHSSPTNPRGWFNDPGLDVTGTNGSQIFRKALLDFTDRSIAILKRTGAQGVLVWDLEGEEYPHKITYLGDPRLLHRLAPEMAPVADEFFNRLRNAGFRVGLTVRSQQLVFDDAGQPHQAQVFDIKRILLEKIDYARTRWGATLFYLDSNGGIRRPDEVWWLRSLAEQRPGILLIPEHHYLPYSAFSAPYVSLRNSRGAEKSWLAGKLFPNSFQALEIDDASNDWARIAVARSHGDILLFRAWYWSPECQLLEGFSHEHP